ncbi:MAG TPA: ATPase, T2SS/T4P/T4SS family [Armatimonadota bacterium]|nr:ATPase, T2SS/T4P/T4SS family [Armatimonadota bacterium]
MAPQEDLLSLGEATAMLGISKPTMYRLLEQGKVKGTKVGNQWRFRRDELAAYLDRGPAAVALSAVPLAALEGELAFFTGALAALGRAPAPEPALDDPAERKSAALVAAILHLAAARGASDIHLDIFKEDNALVHLLRYRIDGVLQEVRRVAPRVFHAILLRLKALAGLEVFTRDGRIALEFDGTPLDIRATLIPALYGETVSLRLLASAATCHLGLDNRGLAEDTLARLRRWLEQSSGLILCTGPAGSGKTTILYEAVLALAGPSRAVYSMENPIELQLPWVTQVSITNRDGATYANALRALMRSDPDVVMIGELQNLETIELGLCIARTGHLVLSQAYSTYASFVPSYLVSVFPEVRWREISYIAADVLIGITCQRLMRTLCPDCRQSRPLSRAVLADLQRQAEHGGYRIPEGATFYTAAGCPACGGTGYRGRTLAFEMLEFVPAVKKAYLAGVTPDELQAVAVGQGMRTLYADAIRLAAEGETTLEEVARLLG